MKNLITLFLLFTVFVAFAQSQTKRVLFIGNSYTYVNDLPKMVSDMAAATGDTLIYDSSTPGGYTLKGHSTNTTTINKIKTGSWDYVVLQEQSQRPAFPITQVQSDVFPYARVLDSLISHHDSCAETVFYMTWGRKNGDASNCAFFPPLCTYRGMDSLLNMRYRMMADSNDAILSPVGAVWNYIRANYPSIELYSPDESHPSVAGTYAAACSFYSTFFRKDPGLVPFNSALPALEAQTIRNAAKVVVFDSLTKWHVGEYDPVAGFNYSVLPDTACLVGFNNTSEHAENYFWDFGDGNSSNLKNPTNIYAASGTYVVTLTATNCSQADTFQTVLSSPCISSIPERDYSELNWKLYPNPAKNSLSVSGTEPTRTFFTIMNLTGQAVQRGSFEIDHPAVNLKTLPCGVYFIHLSNNTQSLGYRRFVKIN